MKYLSLGVKGVAGKLAKKLRDDGDTVFCVSNGVDAYLKDGKDFWIKGDLTEPATPLKVVQKLLKEGPFDGVIFSEYLKVNQDEAKSLLFFHLRKQIEANVIQVYLMYSYLKQYDLLSDECGVLCLLDGTRNELGDNFLMYRLSQDTLILLMGLLTVEKAKPHRLNCVEVGIRPDEESVEIAEKVLKEKRFSGGLILENYDEG